MQTFLRGKCRNIGLRSAAVALATAAATLAACATAPAPNLPSAGANLNQTQPSGPSRWELVRWQQADGTLRDIPHGDNGQPIIFEFSDGIDAAQGTVSGTSGCNRFTGSYGKTDTGVRFDRVAGTRMACPPPRMELESALLKAMEGSFTTVGTQPSSAVSSGRQVVWKTASGDLRVGHAGGSLRLNSLSGDIEVGDLIGDVSAGTASGDISIGAAGASVQAESASGDVEVFAIDATSATTCAL